MLQNINEWLEKEDKASMLLFIILQTRRCICYVRKKMQEEDSRE